MSFEISFELKFQGMMSDLQDESDRAVVIIIAAHLDEHLEEILRLAFVPSWSSSDSLFEGANAPL
ncbi:hypothetical protein ACJJIF_20590 [Microbulbifer sp. SSSA002]|uniref:hypothetical protein n=1 Tax=Microbulbifer sp. SSSA002 TaxID=3243376 RepID=UPI0040390DA0